MCQMEPYLPTTTPPNEHSLRKGHLPPSSKNEISSRSGAGFLPTHSEPTGPCCPFGTLTLESSILQVLPCLWQKRKCCCCLQTLYPNPPISRLLPPLVSAEQHKREREISAHSGHGFAVEADLRVWKVCVCMCVCFPLSHVKT